LIDAVAIVVVLQASERLQDAYVSKRKGRKTMRSDLIFGALTHVNNRYELCQLASKATRKLHKPNTRLQDTTNEVLDRFKDTIPMDDSEAVVEKVQLQERRAA
jgi:predicted transcriptional regulator